MQTITDVTVTVPDISGLEFNFCIVEDIDDENCVDLLRAVCSWDPQISSVITFASY